MKKNTLLLLFFLSITAFAQQQTVTYSVNPASFDETTVITITINGNSINEASWGVVGNALYLWAWAFDLNDTTQKGTPLNGSWNASDEASKFTYNAVNDTYTKTITHNLLQHDRNRKNWFFDKSQRRHGRQKIARHSC